MKKIPFRSLFVFILSFAIYGSVLADAAPPANPPASSIQPNGLTKVRMMSEVVVINVPTVNSDRVDVTADFRMKNLGSVDEQMQVRFPLEEPSGSGDGYGRHPLYEDVVVKVNGRVVVTKRINEPLDSSVAHPRPIEWVTFDVTFPVAAETLIMVSYKSPPLNDAYNRWQISYIFETGRGMV